MNTLKKNFIAFIIGSACLSIALPSQASIPTTDAIAPLLLSSGIVQSIDLTKNKIAIEYLQAGEKITAIYTIQYKPMLEQIKIGDRVKFAPPTTSNQNNIAYIEKY